MSTATLRLGLVQAASSTDPRENLARLDDFSSLYADSDLVVLPEAFGRDFGTPGSPLADHAERLDGPFVTRLAELSREYDVTLLAGMFETHEPTPYNTLVMVRDGALVASYRKIHLYDSFGYRESDVLGAGEIEPVVLEVGGVRVGLMTCYDLRFPELGRLLSDAGADLVVVPAAWVAGPLKVDHWRTLLRARAIENLCWVAGAGQPGPRYTGHSLVAAPDGTVVEELDEHEGVVRAVVGMADVARARETNPSLANRRF